jgi:succinoglycan biosynthesis transport protein ExoP
MVQQNQEPPSQGLKIHDIYYAVFRHKWMIFYFALAGFAAAVALYFILPRLYKSEAKVLIRYIVERKSMTAPEADDQVKSPSFRTDSILNSEQQILSSFDLLQQVATAVGPEKVLGSSEGVNTPVRAAEAIYKGLKVEVPRESAIIQITFTSPYQEIVQPVLRELISNYLKKHLQIHREVGVVDEFLRKQIDELRTRLAQTEEDLRKRKSDAGIISVAETKQAYISEMSKIRQDLFSAEADLEQRKAALGGLTQNVPGQNESRPAEIPKEILDEYLSQSSQLNELLKKESQLLVNYTEQNPEVRRYRQFIEDKKKLLKEMETKTPQLTGFGGLAVGGTNGPINIAAETAGIAALEAKIRVLTNQLAKIQADAASLEEAASAIIELERKKEVDETNYKYYSTALDQAKVDQALGPGKVSNINVVQEPTPPMREATKRIKIISFALVAGLGVGIGLALLVELLLDTSLKRPAEVEVKLNSPLFMTIPRTKHHDFKEAGRATKTAPLGGQDERKELTISYGDVSWKNGQNEIPPWDTRHPLHSYFEALGDRLITDFEMANMTHKPKLVAVTGCAKGAGVSTLATGLAASLSETGGGRVLLVDMNQEQGAAHPMYKGKPGLCGLPEALEQDKRDAALLQENLYVVSASQPDDRLPRVLPKRFTHLVPKMKASDYDYIVFDMPPVDQTSVTARLAGLMDKVLLVVESEKTHGALLQRANALLAQNKANVSSVLNKYQKYVPSTLDPEA